MKTITIYYIATDSYSCFWRGFISTIHKFLPSFKKHVILITDGLEEYDNIKEENGVTIERHYEPHLPWPLVALLKFFYMKKYRPIEGSTHTAYFNANVVFKREFNENIVKKDKIIVPYHTWYAKRGHLYVDPDFPNNPYAQAGLLIIPIGMHDVICDYEVEKITEGLKKNNIPKWHDETILNEWVAKNRSKCVWHNYLGEVEVIDKNSVKEWVNIK